MSKYPQAMYRMPGRDVQTDAGWCEYRIVADDEELQAAAADGWCETSDAAAEALRMAVEHQAAPTGAQVPDDDAPPTRAELEQKATELGIKFDGRWGDKRLAQAIADALKKA